MRSEAAAADGAVGYNGQGERVESGGRLRLEYVCLQATVEGQASHAHVHEIVAGLRRRGWDVGLHEPVYGDGRAPGSLERLARFAALQLSAAMRERRADALYLRSHVLALPSTVLAHLRGVPVVIEINGPHEDLFLAWPWTRRLARPLVSLTRRQWKAADALVAVTPELATWLEEEAGRTDARVVPNGANVDVFSPEAPRRRGLPPRYVVFFGALAPWQGIPDVLEAARRPEWPDDVRLVVVGDGAERAAVQRAAEHDDVVYLGKLPYRETAGVVAGALAGLVPMDGRGERGVIGLSPLKLYETMAAGVPPVVTEMPGPAELVRRHRCGLVVPPSDPEALAEAVALTAGEPLEAAAMGRRAREAAVVECSWDRRAADTDSLLRDLVARSNGGRRAAGSDTAEEV